MIIILMILLLQAFLCFLWHHQLFSPASPQIINELIWSSCMGKLAFLTALQQPQGEGHTRGPRGPCMYPTSLGKIKIMRKEEKKSVILSQTKMPNRIGSTLKKVFKWERCDETILLPGKKLSFLIWPTADHWLNLSPCSGDLLQLVINGVTWCDGAIYHL